MISYISIGSNDVERSCRFFDAALAPLGYARTFSAGGWAGYGLGGKREGLELYICPPYDGKAATFGNGSMLAFNASSREAVDAFHAAALKAGGTDEGAPGVRAQYDPSAYLAYVRDPEGNKFAAIHNG
jgi:catechol 2,3-dioxygenase-like lactoylglutathione lyase family enzyme